MLTITLQCFLNDKNIFHININFTRSLTFPWKLLVMAKHGELFESTILVYVQPLITRLCPFLIHVDKHGFIVHNRFITINHWGTVHYDIIITTNFAATIYRLPLRDIVATKSRQNDISVRYREDCPNISLIYCFNIRQPMRCFPYISAINHENKAWYSLIIICTTFAQYCNYKKRTSFWGQIMKSSPMFRVVVKYS